MVKKAIKMASIGFLTGIAVSTLIPVLIGMVSGAPVPLYPPELAAQLGSMAAAAAVQYLASGLYGSICMGTVLLYDVEPWPLALASGLHCFIIVALFWPLALAMGWFAHAREILLMNAVQIAAYFVIWVCLWAWYKKQVEELNALNEERGHGE